jgi:hypothetical protein
MSRESSEGRESYGVCMKRCWIASTQFLAWSPSKTLVFFRNDLSYIRGILGSAVSMISGPQSPQLIFVGERRAG